MKKITGNQRKLLFLFFFTLFMNGFEAAGYQAGLLTISRAFSLDHTLMGSFASVQLVAGFLAPLFFGPLADKGNKKSFFLGFLFTELTGAALLLAVPERAAFGQMAFLAGIFLIGIGTGGLQYTAIALLADLFPVTGKKKVGLVTGFYSLGAVLAPLLSGLYLERGYSWKILFCVLAASAVCNLVLSFQTGFHVQEEQSDMEKTDHADRPGPESQPDWILSGVLMLCLVMFLYVGFENGFAFFINSYVQEELGGTQSYLALSLFWLAMVPARILCGFLERYDRQILIAGCTGVVLFTALTGLCRDPVLVTMLCLPLGFCSGVVYPAVLGRMIDFARGKTGTATGLITAATGLGGAAITQLTGIASDHWSLHGSLLGLAAFMVLDILAAVMLLFFRKGRQDRSGSCTDIHTGKKDKMK